MAFYDKFPYTNFQELNLDRIIQQLIEVQEGLQFVIDNASLKYADPIQWNITTQYAANTVVIDPQTGTAYLSTKPVPVNILLTNPEYWTPIYTYPSLNVAEPAEWNIEETYDNNTIVTNENIMYISSKDVPAGTPITDAEYWRVIYTPPEIIIPEVKKNCYEFINVTDYGVNNDGSDVSEVLTALITSGYKYLFFPSGTYSFTNLNISDCILIGNKAKVQTANNETTGEFITPFTAMNCDYVQIEGFEITSGTYPTGSNTDHTIIYCENVNSVIIKNCIFHDIYNRFPHDASVWMNRSAVLATLKNCLRTVMKDNEIYRVAGGELTWIISTNNGGYYGTHEMHGNYIHDLTIETYGVYTYTPQSFNIFGDSVTITDNRINNWKTTTGLFNLNGNEIEICENILTDCQGLDVFDCYEVGTMYGKYLNISNNVAEVINGTFCQYRSENAFIRNNKFTGLKACVGYFNTITQSTVIPWNTLEKITGKNIVIDANTFICGHTNRSDVSLEYIIYASMPRTVEGATSAGNVMKKFTLSNNVISCEGYNTSLNILNRYQPVQIASNVEDIYISNNVFTHGYGTGTTYAAINFERNAEYLNEVKKYSAENNLICNVQNTGAIALYMTQCTGSGSSGNFCRDMHVCGNSLSPDGLTLTYQSPVTNPPAVIENLYADALNSNISVTNFTNIFQMNKTK